MGKIAGNCREVCEATELVAMVTAGDNGPHLVGNWGHYMRTLGIEEDRIVLPAGHYHQTERNLGKNSRIQLLGFQGGARVAHGGAGLSDLRHRQDPW
jgi:predicted pyridoxine 5'-phosphate oxidase superfamily flavin-nucleotide-binding protein